MSDKEMVRLLGSIDRVAKLNLGFFISLTLTIILFTIGDGLRRDGTISLAYAWLGLFSIIAGLLIGFSTVYLISRQKV